MPNYDYQCNDCGAVYDVFHKVREVEEDVICPKCNSPKHTRLISAPRVVAKKTADAAVPPCYHSSRCGGSCSMN